MANGKLYTLKRGDTILHLAHENGFRAWEPIWLHPNNAALRQQRPNPHVLATGDQLFIPDKEPLDHSCQTNRKHTFRVPSLTQYLQQTLLDANHEPLAGLPYLLTAGGRQFRGKTDNNGYFKQEIPIHVKTAELKLWLVPGNETSAREWTLEIGHLEPIDTVYGLKGRLKNLGYDCGAVNDQLDQKTKDALLAFQFDHSLPTTGELDAETRSLLLNLHDRPLEA